MFCSILAGQTSADFVLRTPEVSAFLDVRPLFRGHVLVVPREHVVTIGEIAPAQIAPLFGAVSRIARAIEAGLGAHGSFVAINNTVSQSVPHLHVHVVPRHKGDGLRGFFWPRAKYESDEQRLDYAARIANALE